MPRFLRTSKRRPLFPQYHRLGDPEKHDSAADEQDWQSTSSRSSSFSHPGDASSLLSPSRAARRAHAYSFSHRLFGYSKRFNLLFTVVLGSILVFTAAYLYISGRESTRAAAHAAPLQQPNIWEEFPPITRYFGGVRTIVKREDTKPEYPGDAQELVEEIRELAQKHGLLEERDADQADTTPQTVRLQLDSDDAAAEDDLCMADMPALHVHHGVPRGFPEQVIGSYDELGLDAGVCFDRFGRLGPYGLGYTQKFGGTSAGMEGDRDGIDQIWAQNKRVDYRAVRWAELITKCNSRTTQEEEGMKSASHSIGIRSESAGRSKSTSDSNNGRAKTVILVRTWSDHKYDAEDVLSLRALVSELALSSAGRYAVHFLVQVRDDDSDVEFWTDAQERDRLLRESLPDEFHGMATLWSARQVSHMYDGLWGSLSAFLPVQHFAQQHPEYDFVWNWDIGVRYTGHLKQFLDHAGAWAQKQPRKGLWERSARFYVPADHGPWQDFVQMVRVQTEHKMASSSPVDVYARLGIASKNPLAAAAAAQSLVWGPEPPIGQEHNETDPQPPRSYHADKYEWGVGEDADLVTLSPIFNPDGTLWESAQQLTGYDDMPPRRASIGTTLRLSKRLLDRMHQETVAGRQMATEMWPASVALHRGLKAVHVPHPVYVDRKWPVDYLAAVFNGGRNGAAGGARPSVFGRDRDHVFKGTTWHTDTEFATKLWKRWLGYRVDGQGGEEWELSNEGRMCLPPMLLYPVKHIDLVYTDDA